MKRTYLSTSALKAFAKSPNHCLAYYNKTIEPTPAMILGTAIHTAVLEPHKMASTYMVMPEGIDRRTKTGKETAERITSEAALAGQTVITAEQHETIRAVVAAVRTDAASARLLEQAQEFEVTKSKPVEGVEYRGIIDIVGPGWLADLKTTSDASAEAFNRQSYSMMYHEQAAAYAMLHAESTEEELAMPFYFIAVETAPPYNTQVFRQDEASRRKARHHLLDLVRRWKEWDGKPGTYSNEITPLTIPSWAK